MEFLENSRGMNSHIKGLLVLKTGHIKIKTVMEIMDIGLPLLILTPET
ncbi:hypothetical protein SDC9_190595 [bioreactor metagenome]|uniref:Uncharacterized protein n=1 Tax=bioreactor metagenome TaxID=1076179 RepID=A0A645HWS1_9ZZZZ